MSGLTKHNLGATGRIDELSRDLAEGSGSWSWVENAWMEFQGYSEQTPIIFPQLLGGDRRAGYKSGDCRSICAVRVNGKLQASLRISAPDCRNQITESSILSPPTKAVTRANRASCRALG